MSDTRLHIAPEIIRVVNEVGARYAERIRQQAPRTSGEEPHLITEMHCACKKYKPASAFPLYDTGHIKAFDTVCADCPDVRKWAKMARVVCKNCRVPVLFVSPHKDDKGFEFVAGRSYHLTGCFMCDPDMKSAIPVEKIVFDHRQSGSRLPLKEFMRMALSSAQ